MAILSPQLPVLDAHILHHPQRDAAFSPGEPVNAFREVNNLVTLESILNALQTCRNQESSYHAKHLHTHICEMGMDSNEVLCNHLVPTLVDCGSIHEAQNVFNKSNKQSEHAWTSLIQGYAEFGDVQCMFDVYEKMKYGSIQPSDFTYVALLKGCCKWQCLHKGMEIHDIVISHGCESNPFVVSTLVDMYATCGFVQEAQFVFGSLPTQNAISWTALISGHIQNNLGDAALHSLEEMQVKGFPFDAVTLNCGLKACSLVGALERGQRLHAEVTKGGYDCEILLANTLIDMYTACGHFAEARQVHDKLANRNTISWTALLRGCLEIKAEKEVLSLLEMMQLEGTLFDEAAFVCGLQICGAVKELTQGQVLHMKGTYQGLSNDAYVGAAVVDMYIKCGSLDEAQSAFVELSVQNVEAWNAMLEGFIEHGLYEHALDSIAHMQQDGLPPDNITYVWSMKSCAALRSKERTHDLHAQIVKKGLEDDAFVSCSTVDAYIKCDSLVEAQEVFDGLLVKDPITYNALITGYLECGCAKDVLQCFQQMLSQGISPSLTSYSCSLKACGRLGHLNVGQTLHIDVLKQGLEQEIALGNSLIDMYLNCRTYLEGQAVFDSLQDRDAISWTTLILGCAECELGKTALELFQEMQLEGIPPDEILWNAVILCSVEQGDCETALDLYSRMLNQGFPPNIQIRGSVVQACSKLGALEIGKRIHAQSREVSETILGTALVELYCECGSMEEAQQAFNSIILKDVVAWDALIKGYSRQAEAGIVWDILQKLSVEGIELHEGIFLSSLLVSSHAGLVHQGQVCFEKMSNLNETIPGFAQYNALLDLLGRAGQLDEAFATTEFFISSLSEPIFFETILGACRKWNSVELGESAFSSLLAIDVTHPGAYISMSNIYADSSFVFDIH